MVVDVVLKENPSSDDNNPSNNRDDDTISIENIT